MPSHCLERAASRATHALPLTIQVVVRNFDPITRCVVGATSAACMASPFDLDTHSTHHAGFIVCSFLQPLNLALQPRTIPYHDPVFTTSPCLPLPSYTPPCARCRTRSASCNTMYPVCNHMYRVCNHIFDALQDLVPLLSEKAIKHAEHDGFLAGLWTVRSSKQ